MKLEPVYLLAPKPPVPSIPTRRAFLFVGGAFVLGAGVGGACGYSVGVQRGDGAAADSGGKLPESSGNAELDELRRLALVAPVEELAGKWLYFVDVFSTDYRDDKYLPVGVTRLIDFLAANPDFAERKMAAVLITDAITRGEPAFHDAFEPRLPELRRMH